MKFKFNKTSKIIAGSVLLLIVVGSAFYFSYKELKVKQAQKLRDYLFSMKQKCTDVANQAYNQANKESGQYDSIKLWRYAYSPQRNSCIYEISLQSKPGGLDFYDISVKDALSGETLANYSRLGDENPPFDDYQKKSNEIFSQ